MMTTPVPLIDRLDEIAGHYAVLLCDVWGVVHNGVTAFAGASEALSRARRAGAVVVLVTNAARSHGEVAEQLAALGVPRDSWDRIVTSGDVTRSLVRAASRKVFHLGRERDLVFFSGIDVDLVDAAEAEVVVCTALRDDDHEPALYREMLGELRGRDLPFICANPDIFFERGDRRIWCAGALAAEYEKLGGRVLVAGKPHRPIYEASLNVASRVAGRPLLASEALAIGDGILTDVTGAVRHGIDVLYVSGGIHAGEYGDTLRPDGERLATFLAAHGLAPTAAIPVLR